MKSLVVYFSRDGKAAAVSGKSKTQILAEKVQEFTGSDIYKIVPVEPYSQDDMECDRRAKEESQTNAKPAINGALPDVSGYELIYLGFPNWYRSFPRIIGTFLDSVNLKGKIIKPFCTNEEGGFGIGELELKGRAKGATLKNGFSCKSEDVLGCDERLKAWLMK